MTASTKTGPTGPGSLPHDPVDPAPSHEAAPPLADDLRLLAAQAEALRRKGNDAAADQVLAWRDLHALRLGLAGRPGGGRSGE